MTYKDEKNAEATNPAATYHHHEAFETARAYRDYKNREITAPAFEDYAKWRL